MYEKVYTFVRSFVSLSVVSARGVHPIRATKRDASEKFRRGERGKNPVLTSKYTKFGQFIIGKIIKIIVTRGLILRLKCTKFDSWRLSVCLLG